MDDRIFELHLQPIGVRAGACESSSLGIDGSSLPRIFVDPKVLKDLKGNPLLRAHAYEQEIEYIRPLIKKGVDGVDDQ